MEKEEVKKQVFKIIQENLNVEEKDIKDDSHIQDDLGADSLDLVELVMALEDAFETEIYDEEAEKLVSVDKIVDYISKNC